MKGKLKPLWPLSEEGGPCENAQACFPVCIFCESENSRFLDTWWSDRFGMLTSRSTQITSSFHRRSKEFGSKYKKRRWWQTSKTKSSKYFMRWPSLVKHHHEIQLNPDQQSRIYQVVRIVLIHCTRCSCKLSRLIKLLKWSGGIFWGIGTILEG